MCRISDPSRSVREHSDTGQSTLFPDVWELRIACTTFRCVLYSSSVSQITVHSPTMHLMFFFSMVMIPDNWCTIRRSILVALGFDVFRFEILPVEDSAACATFDSGVGHLLIGVSGRFCPGETDTCGSGTTDAWRRSNGALESALVQQRILTTRLARKRYEGHNATYRRTAGTLNHRRPRHMWR